MQEKAVGRGERRNNCTSQTRHGHDMAATEGFDTWHKKLHEVRQAQPEHAKEGLHTVLVCLLWFKIVESCGLLQCCCHSSEKVSHHGG